MPRLPARKPTPTISQYRRNKNQNWVSPLILLSPSMAPPRETQPAIPQITSYRSYPAHDAFDCHLFVLIQTIALFSANQESMQRILASEK
jgi:hypothetical protein